MAEHFGKVGVYYYDIAHGLDNRPVNPQRVRKSIGKETTLTEDIDDKGRMIEILAELALQIEHSLKKNNIKGRTLTLKIKYFDFQIITRGITDVDPIESGAVIMQHVEKLLDKTEAGKKKVRLLGITISNFNDVAKSMRKWHQAPLPLSWE
jgi:DNA polymerase-4